MRIVSAMIARAKNCTTCSRLIVSANFLFRVMHIAVITVKLMTPAIASGSEFNENGPDESRKFRAWPRF